MTDLQKRIYTDESLYERYEQVFSKDYFKKVDEHVDTIENAIVLPLKKHFNQDGKGYFLGGIVDTEGKFFKPSAHIHNLASEVGSLINGYTVDIASVETENKEVVYGGLLYKHFGHSLIESVSRLWYVIKYGVSSLPIVFVCENPDEIPSQIIDFFELAGLRKEQLIFIDKPKQFRKIIVPCQSSVCSCYYSDLFLIPYRAAVANIQAKPYDRVYLSRRKFRSGFTIIGEEKLENAFKANGFKIIYPERLSLREQLSYIKGAKEIASVMGTATHLSLFSDKKTKNIVLERSEDIIYEQIIINQAVELDWYSLCGNLNYLPAGHEFSPILLGFTDHVAEFFKDRGFTYKEKDVNRISDRAVRKFNRAFFARYSSNKYNNVLAGMDPVYVHRIKKCCSTAFLSLRQHLFMKRTDGLFRIYTIFGFSFKVRKK